MNAILVFLTLLSAWSGQVPTGANGSAPRKTTAMGSSTGSVSGKVIAADGTGALRGATVTLRDSNGAIVAKTQTESAGAFVLAGLAAGTWHVFASKPGYALTEFGASDLAAGVPIVLARGEMVVNLSIRLPKSAVMSGRLVDRDGDPAEGLVVAAVLVTEPSNGRHYTVTASAVTDDTGAYRISGLNSGRYLLVAVARMEATAPPRAGQPTRKDWAGISQLSREIVPQVPPPGAGFAPAFYPGTVDESQAQEITLFAGDERTGLDFRADPTLPAAAIEGNLSLPQEPMLSVQVTAFPAVDTPSSSLRRFRPQAAVVHSFRFRLSGLIPGRYTVLARASKMESAPVVTPASSSPSWWALADITVRADETAELPLDLAPGWRVAGVVSQDGAVGGGGPFTVRLSPQAREGFDFLLPPARASATGAFQFTGLPPGDYVVDVLDASGSGRAIERVQLNGVTTEHSGALRISSDIESVRIVVAKPGVPATAAAGSTILHLK